MRWLDGITDPMDISLSSSRNGGQESLAFCSLWDCTESDTTEDCVLQFVGLHRVRHD